MIIKITTVTITKIMINSNKMTTIKEIMICKMKITITINNNKINPMITTKTITNNNSSKTIKMIW